MYATWTAWCILGAHIFGATAIVLMLTWLYHFRGGMNINSTLADKIFNVHPFLMFFGFIFMSGQAMMAYKTVMAERKVRKFVHGTIHLISIALGIIGIYAVFKYHRQIKVPDMYSLHSWIGLGTFILYGFQWFIGLFTFGYPGAPQATRARVVRWHAVAGRILLCMSIVTAETGLMQKATYLQLRHGKESRLINFTGLFILFFGIAVDFSLAFRVFEN